MGMLSSIDLPPCPNDYFSVEAGMASPSAMTANYATYIFMPIRQQLSSRAESADIKRVSE